MNAQRRLARKHEAASKQAGQPSTRVRRTSDGPLHVVAALGDVETSAIEAADVVLGLARAVAHPGSFARELLPDNTAGRHLSLSVAADEAVAHFVVVADDVLAADFDKADAATAAEVLALALRLRGLTPVIQASGQPGRRHVFARVRREDWMEEFKHFARDLGGDVRAAIRPPLSPHRLGRQPDVAVRLLAPATPSEAVRALSAASWSGSVSDRMWRVIVTGEGHDYASTSELVLAAACAVLNIGWGVEDFLELLKAEGFAVAGAYADRVERRGSDATDWWLRSQIWPAADSRVSDSPAVGRHDAERLSAMEIWALSRSWPGRGGAAEQAVYLALIHKASLTSRLEFNASFRELAERAGISGLSTVDRALKALRIEGLVQITTTPAAQQDDNKPEFRSGTTWELRWLEEMGSHMGQAGPVADFPALLSHDLWRNKVGLGKGAARLYFALVMAPGTPGELAQRLGLKVASARRQLNVLAANGLAVRDQHGRWLNMEVDFDDLAEQLGATGRGARQHQQHQSQRDGYDRIMTIGIRAVRLGVDDQTWSPGHPLSPWTEPTEPPAPS